MSRNKMPRQMGINILKYPYAIETAYRGEKFNIRFLYDPKIQGEATSTPKEIRLGDKFYDVLRKYPESGKHILIHEIGHDLSYKESDRVVFHNHELLEKEMYGYAPKKGIGNAEEVFAETFAVYVIDPERLRKDSLRIFTLHKQIERKYPDHYKFGREISSNKFILHKYGDGIGKQASSKKGREKLPRGAEYV